MHNLRFLIAASAAIVIGAAVPAFAQDSLTLKTVAETDVGKGLAPDSSALTAARIVRSAPAEWPPFERLANIGGTAQIQVELDATGRLVSTAVLVSSGHPGLDRSAVDAVRASTYQAASINGRAIGGRYIVQAVFDPLL